MNKKSLVSIYNLNSPYKKSEIILERDTRIELAPQPWEGRVLPLY